MNEKVGTIAGQIWNALNDNGALNTKDLKKGMLWDYLIDQAKKM